VSRRDDRGAVAVEFALLVPILVVILFAIIAVGIAL
jgi:Flp pilus assembly protein TadG